MYGVNVAAMETAVREAIAISFTPIIASRRLLSVAELARMMKEFHGVTARTLMLVVLFVRLPTNSERLSKRTQLSVEAI